MHIYVYNYIMWPSISTYIMQHARIRLSRLCQSTRPRIITQHGMSDVTPADNLIPKTSTVHRPHNDIITFHSWLEPTCHTTVDHTTSCGPAPNSPASNASWPTVTSTHATSGPKYFTDGGRCVHGEGHRHNGFPHSQCIYQHLPHYA